MIKPVIDIRWIRDDEHHEVIKLFADSSRLKLKDMQEFMVETDHLPYVLTVDRAVVGANFYVLHRKVVMIKHLAIAPGVRRLGYARRMIQQLKRSLSTLRRRVIAAEVREDNLPAQLLFKKCGFKCYRTIRKPDEDCDYYIFRYEAPPKK